MSLVRLNAAEHDLSTFFCGDADLDEYLRQDAVRSQSDLLGVTYLLIDDGQVVAYVTLLNDRIGVEENIGI